MDTTADRRADRAVPPEAYFVGSAVFHYLGPAFAVLLFALVAVGLRTRRNGLALAAAVGGVYLLTNVQLVAEPLGVAFAFANAALFALYIVLGHRVSRLPAMGGIDGLAGAMLVALVVATPLGGWAAVPAFGNPVALLAGI